MKLSFIDFAKTVLRASNVPLTANEVWTSGCAMGLDLQLGTTGKTPKASLEAQLYVAAANAKSGIISIGSKPKQFKLDETQVTAIQPLEISVQVEPKIAQSSKTYSFTECAKKILEQFGNKNPMHYNVITNKALELGWLDSDGLTPNATMYAQILTEIKRKQSRGETPIFVKHGRGYVGLSRWMGKGLRFQIEEHNKAVSQHLYQFLTTLSPTQFEELIGQLLGAMGYDETQVTNRSNDGGIDVRGTWVITEGVRIKMAVQVKKWKSNVQRPVVQALRGSLSTNERGLIITTSDFSSTAKEEAEDPTKASPISLINGKRLVNLLIEYNIGITRESTDILELDTTAFSTANTNEIGE